MRVFLVISLFALHAILAGCSTIVEGDDQTVTIVTDPAEATCVLTRGGETVGAVNPSPGSIVVEKGSDDIGVICKKAGHFDGAAVLASSVEGMTFGNILFGGLIGVAVDAGSGAMHRYPGSVTVVLTPKSFRSSKELENFFERQKRRVESEAESAIVEARKSCNPDERDCDAIVEAIGTARDAKLRELEAQARAATVGGG